LSDDAKGMLIVEIRADVADVKDLKKRLLNTDGVAGVEFRDFGRKLIVRHDGSTKCVERIHRLIEHSTVRRRGSPASGTGST
jgi:hypothetical protein